MMRQGNMSFFAPLLSFLLVTAAAEGTTMQVLNSRSEVTAYWQTVFPDTAMPSAILDLILPPAAGNGHEINKHDTQMARKLRLHSSEEKNKFQPADGVELNPAILYAKGPDGVGLNPAILYAKGPDGVGLNPTILYAKGPDGVGLNPAILYAKGPDGVGLNPAILYAKGADGVTLNPAILYAKGPDGVGLNPAILYAKGADGVEVNPAILYAKGPDGVGLNPAILYAKGADGVEVNPAILYAKGPDGVDVNPAILYAKGADGVEVNPAILYAKGADGVEVNPAILYAKGADGVELNPAILYAKGEDGVEVNPAILYAKGADGVELNPAILYAKRADGVELNPAILYAKGADGVELNPAILYAKGTDGIELNPAILYAKRAKRVELNPAILYAKGANRVELNPAILYAKDAKEPIHVSTANMPDGVALNPAILYAKGADGVELNPAILYAKGADGVELNPAILYSEESERVGLNPAILYAKEAERVGLNPAILYAKEAKQPIHATVSNMLASGHGHHVHGGSHMDLRNIGFLEEVLKPGSKIAPYIHPAAAPAPLLRRAAADSIPMSTKSFAAITRMLAPAPVSRAMAKNIWSVLELCEHPNPAKGERKACASSVESMVEFAASVLGTRALRAFSSPNVPAEGRRADAGPSKAYRVAAVRAVTGTGNTMTCHGASFPYKVFVCHSLNPTRVYSVALESEEEKMEGLAVCHLNTSEFDPMKMPPGFRPGDTPVCHFLNGDSILWAPAATSVGTRGSGAAAAASQQ